MASPARQPTGRPFAGERGVRAILAGMWPFRRQDPRPWPLWMRYYRQWLTTAFKPLIRLVEGISLLLSLLVPAGIAAYKYWGASAIPAEWEGIVNALMWLVPSGVTACLVGARLILAPYWLYRRSQQGRSDATSMSEGFIARRGPLDFMADIPRAGREIGALQGQISNRIDALYRDLERYAGRAQTAGSFAKRRDHAGQGAKALRRHAAWMEKRCHGAEDLVAQAHEGLVGLMALDIDKITNRDALEHAQTLLTLPRDSSALSVDEVGKCRAVMQDYRDNPVSQSLAAAAADADSVLHRLERLFLEVVTAWDEVIAMLAERVAELGKTTEQ